MVYLPSDDELAKYYEHYNDSYTAGMDLRRFEFEMPRRHAAKLNLIGRYVRNGRLLDVGCGEGLFLQRAAAFGYAAVGCDFSVKPSYPDAVVVFPGKLDCQAGLPFPEQSFDVVTAWAVLEHVKRPHVAMDEVNRVLKPGGYFFCDTPLVGDLSERLVAARSHWLCPPEHIHVFSRRSLGYVVGKHGLTVLKQYPFFERSRVRWWMRRLRNLAMGLLVGGATKILRPAEWARSRQVQITMIGDIQLLVARKEA